MTGTPDVRITHKAADAADEVMGVGRDAARAWLEQALRQGRITAELPHPYSRKRSQSGYFLLVEGTLVMPLTRTPEGTLLATGCSFFPAYLHAQGRGGKDVDPFALRGSDLVERVAFSEHVLERYTQRALGLPERKLTDEEKGDARLRLVHLLVDDASAVRKRPAWYRSRTPADFFLVAASGEVCLPMRRTPGEGKPFYALTFLHRSMELFDLEPEELARACRFSPPALQSAAGLAGEQPAGSWLSAQIAAGGRLSWHPPEGEPSCPEARFYILARPVFLPVEWDKGARQPLVVLDVRRTTPSLRRRVALWPQGLGRWLRKRFALRVS